MKVTALYRLPKRDEINAVTFEYETLKTRGRSGPVNCDRPEIEKDLVARMRGKLSFYDRGKLIDPPAGLEVLAFYCDTRREALIDRWGAPIVLLD